jgi:prepilin-type N-terminal cleavage/methylation domain-containing protein
MVIKRKTSKAFSLTEVMLAVAIIGIVAAGVLDYQYHSLKQSRIAQVQISAARVAQLLLEDWKSTGGSTSYNPSNLNMGFSSSAAGSDFTTGYSIGGILNNAIYTINMNGVPMLVVLAYNDVAHDEVADTTLRQITAMVRWRMGKAVGSGGNTLCTSPVILSTYVRLDG